MTEVGEVVSAWGFARCIMWGRMIWHDVAVAPALEMSRNL